MNEPGFAAAFRNTSAEWEQILRRQTRAATRLDELPANITVCDPAIGSVAFPVGMMHEIVRARMTLTPAVKKPFGPRGQAERDPALGGRETPGASAASKAPSTLRSAVALQNRSPYALKRHDIHDSLYGVDLDPGAVEIAKLRLWLSMVVDEDEIGDIQPLPNLDTKLMREQGLEAARIIESKALP